jgi:hypothetical protein
MFASTIGRPESLCDSVDALEPRPHTWRSRSTLAPRVEQGYLYLSSKLPYEFTRTMWMEWRVALVSIDGGETLTTSPPADVTGCTTSLAARRVLTTTGRHNAVLQCERDARHTGFLSLKSYRLLVN